MFALRRRSDVPNTINIRCHEAWEAAQPFSDCRDLSTNMCSCQRRLLSRPRSRAKRNPQAYSCFRPQIVLDLDQQVWFPAVHEIEVAQGLS
jgi:hypothetical protein